VDAPKVPSPLSAWQRSQFFESKISAPLTGSPRVPELELLDELEDEDELLELLTPEELDELETPEEDDELETPEELELLLDGLTTPEELELELEGSVPEEDDELLELELAELLELEPPGT
jgi:hypothetical protein